MTSTRLETPPELQVLGACPHDCPDTAPWSRRLSTVALWQCEVRVITRSPRVSCARR